MTVSQPFAYTTGALGTALDTISYGYGDSSRNDLLTSYDGQMLASDIALILPKGRMDTTLGLGHYYLMLVSHRLPLVLAKC